MKKKRSAEKLTLKRETVHALANAEILEGVEGGKLPVNLTKEYTDCFTCPV